MLCEDNGVLTPSKVYFSTAASNAQPWLMTLVCTGLYDCDNCYRVERNNYSSGLLLLVLAGSGYVVMEGRRHSLHTGDLLLLNCFTPHAYGTDEGFQILWVHFTGGSAHAMLNSLSPTQAILRPDAEAAHRYRNLRLLYDMFDGGRRLGDAMIHRVLTELATAFFMPREASNAREQESMEEIAAYLTEHMAQNTPNTALANMAHMSESQLIRTFKHEKGVTPHRYLLNVRLNAVQYLLTSTRLSLSRIAELCGFTDASALANAFRRETGFTPREYAQRL